MQNLARPNNRQANSATNPRRHLFAIAPAVLVAFLLPRAFDDFNDQFTVQAFLMACFFAAAYFALRPARERDGTSPGLRVMSIALLLLTLDFLHDVPLLGTRNGLWGVAMPTAYLKFIPIFDLILETLLGFGTIMLMLEGVRREVEATNRELITARDKLELVARVDPLTNALNRHAFYSLLSKDQDAAQESVSGCVAVIDIDNLKPLNDSFGHAAGDVAIRAVARALRATIRADDMLFRWGGDEFLLLLFNIPHEEVSKRMNSINACLMETKLPGQSAPVSISVSYGLACFKALTQLHEIIEQADQAMYKQKQLYKSTYKTEMPAHKTELPAPA